jgi:hypothetical protein
MNSLHPSGQVHSDHLQIITKPDVRLIDDLVIYWEQKRTGRIAPRRVDIDLSEMTSHIPHIFILDVIDAGADFRFRLIGPRIVEGMGRDSTGHKFSEVYRDQPQALKELSGLFRLSVNEKCPVFARGSVFWLPRTDIGRFASGHMPLSDDGANVNAILAEWFVSYPHQGRC